MPGFMLHVGFVSTCPHLAPITTVPSQPRVFVSGQAVATMANVLTVGPCPFQVPVGPGTKPQPCVIVKWANVSTRVAVNGQPILLHAPPPGPAGAVCQSVEQIPQGPPIVNVMQTRVLAT
jgi:hypothetical protein